MRRIGALIVATAALAVGAAPAYAVLPPAPDTGGVTGGMRRVYAQARRAAAAFTNRANSG